jgi:hypothetical protein
VIEMNSFLRPLALAALVVGSALAPANAADPAEGTLSKSVKEAKWRGEASGYGVIPVNTVQNTAPLVCEQPICDKYTLKVADAGGDVKISVMDDFGLGFVQVDIKKPGGDWEYNLGPETKPTVVSVKNAPAGDYELRITTNDPPTFGAYAGTATLTFPKPEGAPPETPPGTTVPGPGTTQTPPPGSPPPPATPPAQPGQLPASGPLSVDAAMDKGKRATARKRGLRARLRCTVVCRASAVASVDKKTAAKLKLGKKAFVIAQGSARIDKPGRIPFIVKLNAKAKKALGKKVKGLKRLSVSVQFVVTDDQRGQIKQIKRKITLR